MCANHLWDPTQKKVGKELYYSSCQSRTYDYQYLWYNKYDTYVAHLGYEEKSVVPVIEEYLGVQIVIYDKLSLNTFILILFSAKSRSCF